MKKISFLSILGSGLLVLLVSSCEPKMTLQRYFLSAQENPEFTLIEVPVSLLGPVSENLNAEQRQTLSSIKKVSVLLYRNLENVDFIASQQLIINDFLASDGFQPLFSAKMKREAQATFMIRGDVNQIDEAVFFGYADDQGFILARILGNQMNPAAFMQLAESLEETNLDALTEGVLKQVLGETEL